MKKRQNPLTTCPIEEVEFAFAKIEQHFGAKWLQSEAGTHPIQLLWNRRDALSTNELFTFGRSLIAAEDASVDWLKGQIKLVRGKDENNQRGSIFEILAVGYTASHQIVTPAPANQPGYDIDIENSLGTSYRVSLKRYSQSTHERLFRKKSEIAETKLLDIIKRSRINTQFYIEAREYPDESDWQKLYSEVCRLASEFRGSKTIVEIESRWLVALLPLAPEPQEIFDDTNISYSFVCASPYHKNEQRNFNSKLEAAVHNLERHVACDSLRHPVILMLLPVTASATSLSSWAQEYLNANQSSSVQAVFFLQPYTASNEDMSSSYIAHFISAAVSGSFYTTSKQPLKFEVPVGIVTKQPPGWKLQSDIGESPLLGQYVYQKGKHYILATDDGAGGLSANIARKAPGIESIAVFSLNGEKVALGGRWGEDLCLIGG